MYDIAMEDLGKWNLSPYKDLHISVHITIMYNSQEVQTNQTPGTADKENVLYPCDRILVINIKELNPDTCTT